MKKDRENPFLEHNFSESELVEQAKKYLSLARNEKNNLKKLACLQLTSDALVVANKTIEDLGFEIGDVIAISNTAYSGNKDQVNTIHTIASDIISSFPNKLVSKEQNLQQ